MQPIYLYNMCGCVYVSVHARQVSSTKKNDFESGTSKTDYVILAKHA